MIPKHEHPGRPDGSRDETMAAAMIEELPSHVAVLNPAGEIVATSGAWRRYLSENGGDGSVCGVGANYLKVCDAAAKTCRDAARVAKGIRAVISGETEQYHYTYECSGPGDRQWYQVRVHPMKPVPGCGRLVMVVHQSITEAESRAEARLARLTEAAHASRLCLIGMSTVELIHEVTQPLAAVRNYAAGSLRQLARGGPIEKPAMAEVFDMITREVGRAEAIVRRARAFASRSESVREPFDAAAMLRELLSLWDSHLRSVGCAVITDETPEAVWPESTVVGDRAQIEQIIINALSNAAEALKPGAPGAGAGSRPASPEIEVLLTRRGKRVRIEVRDRGPGIPADLLPRLFEPFHTTKRHGLGMGLAISRSIAEAHFGTVDLRNRTDGAGAVFILELPIHAGGRKSKESERHAA